VALIDDNEVEELGRDVFVIDDRQRFFRPGNQLGGVDFL
jgi:hypothetical protein